MVSLVISIKAGTGSTCRVNVVSLAHWPESGVNVYVVVAVVFKAGDQVPVTGVALFDVVGNAVTGAPIHTDAAVENAGVTFWFTTMVNAVSAAH